MQEISEILAAPTIPLEALWEYRGPLAHRLRSESFKSFSRTSQHLAKRTRYPVSEATRILRTLKRKLIDLQSRNFRLKMAINFSKLNTPKIMATTCTKQLDIIPSALFTTLQILAMEQQVAQAWPWIRRIISHHKAKKDFRVLKNSEKSQPRSRVKVDRLFYQQAQAYKVFLNWNLNCPRVITPIKTKTLNSCLSITRFNRSSNLVNKRTREWTQCKIQAHWEPTCKEASTLLRMRPSNSRPRSCRYTSNKILSTWAAIAQIAWTRSSITAIRPTTAEKSFRCFNNSRISPPKLPAITREPNNMFNRWAEIEKTTPCSRARAPSQSSSSLTAIPMPTIRHSIKTIIQQVAIRPTCKVPLWGRMI